MSTDTKVEAPVDDAVVVNDEQSAETSHEELVAKVAKAVGRDEWGDETGDATSGATDEPTESEETPSEVKAEDEKPALDADLQARAEKAGFTTELAEQLHQNGQLVDTLTAFDRAFVERFQDKEPEKKEPDVKSEEKTEAEEMPELDPDIYDEEIVKRDRHHRTRIDSLEEQIEVLIQDRQDAFEGWFDEAISEMGYDIKDEAKCQRTFKKYKALCESEDVSPEKRDKAILELAHAAAFPKEAEKQKQQQNVNSLRDAEGKFLPSSKPTGQPPQRDMTPEESHNQLVAQVTAYGKKHGVNWG